MSPNTLPHDPNPFVGRTREMAELAALVADARWTTLTGVGGVGKSRLALATARHLVDSFPGGVHYVSLGDLSGDGDVVAHLARSLTPLSVSADSPLEVVTQLIGAARVLVVVDEADRRLADAAEGLSALIGALPHLHILATSRVPLDTPSEHLFPVSPLAAGEDRQTDAYALFESRAARLIPGWRPAEGEESDIAELVTRLDGLPLAIELAVARLRTLSPRQMIDRLENRFTLLRPVTTSRPTSPHQNLEDVIAWSYENCTQQERLLAKALTVFDHDFESCAATAVGGALGMPPDVVDDALQGLLNRSMLSSTRVDRQRIRMLDTIREYVLSTEDQPDRLANVARVRDRHYRDIVANAERVWFGPHQLELTRQLLIEQSNVWTSLASSVTQADTPPPPLGLSLGASWFLSGAGRLDEGVRLLRELSLRHNDPEVVARSHWLTSWVASVRGDAGATIDAASRCLEVASNSGHQALTLRGTQYLGVGRLLRGEVQSADDLLHKALEGARASGDELLEATSLARLGQVHLLRADNRGAVETCRRALDISAGREEMWVRAYTLWVLAIALWQLGRLDEALESATESRTIKLRFADASGVAQATEVRSWILADLGQTTEARDDLATAAELWRTSGAKLFAHLRGFRVSAVKMLSSDAPDEPSPTERMEARATPLSALTARQLEVAQLVATGASNAQIAHRLGISPRTTEGHVQNCLHRVGARSRTELAVWYIESYAADRSRLT